MASAHILKKRKRTAIALLSPHGRLLKKYRYGELLCFHIVFSTSVCASLHHGIPTPSSSM